MGAHDLIIAATAISLYYTVATANIRDFEKIPGIKMKNFYCHEMPKGKSFEDGYFKNMARYILRRK